MFLCGIARNQAEMLDLFDQVFLLMIDEETQRARLAAATLRSPVRTEAVRQQIRDGRGVFQAQMLTRVLPFLSMGQRCQRSSRIVSWLTSTLATDPKPVCVLCRASQ